MAPDNKLLIRDVDGRSMVAVVTLACLASRAARVCVVVGHQADRVERAIHLACPDAALAFVHAGDHAAGLSASLRAGIGAVPDWADGVLVCLGDMPLVRAATMDRIIAAWAPSLGRTIIVPTWQGRRGNPVLWDRCHFARMAALSGDAGARRLLDAYAGEVAEVAVDDPGVLVDFDTPAAMGTGFRPASLSLAAGS